MKRILLVALVVLSPSYALAEFPYLKVNIINFTDASAADVERVTLAGELVEQVVNSNEFRDRVLNMTYRKSGKDYVGYTQTTDTPDQILGKIIQAQENFTGGSEGVLDYYLDMYYKNNRVIGYTSQTDKYIHMNRKFHRSYTPARTTANLFHEWLHKIGYGHSYSNNSSRPHSVPYKLGSVMGEMAATIAANGDPVAQAEFRAEFAKSLAEDFHE